jgi:hypothetical protein
MLEAMIKSVKYLRMGCPRPFQEDSTNTYQGKCPIYKYISKQGIHSMIPCI